MRTYHQFVLRLSPLTEIAAVWQNYVSVKCPPRYCHLWGQSHHSMHSNFCRWELSSLIISLYWCCRRSLKLRQFDRTTCLSSVHPGTVTCEDNLTTPCIQTFVAGNYHPLSSAYNDAVAAHWNCGSLTELRVTITNGVILRQLQKCERPYHNFI